MENIEFEALIALVREGDGSAANQLVERFGPEVMIMARKRLPSQLRRRYETMDVFQDVWKSLIEECRDRPVAFECPAQLKAFMAVLVQNKVINLHRRSTYTQKYDIRREEPLYVRKGDREVPIDIASSDSTPSAFLQAEDRRELIKAGLGPVERKIIDLKAEGLSSVEIGEKVGLHERRIRRLLDGLRRIEGGVACP